MHTCLTHSAFELVGILHHLGDGGFLFAPTLHLFAVFQYVGDVHFGSLTRFLVFVILQAVGDYFFEVVYFVQRYFLYSSYVGNGKFCCHSTVVDDMCDALFAVFVCNPLEYLRQTVVVEVDVYIGQRYTVGIEKPLEEKVVFEWVYIGYFQTICDDRTCRRTSSGTYPDVHLPSRSHKVLHYEEITRESHRFYSVQFEVDTLAYVVCYVGISFFCPVVGDFGQIVGFEFYAV